MLEGGRVILFCHFDLSLNLVYSIKLPSLGTEPGTHV